jgi:hypothetical protein
VALVSVLLSLLLFSEIGAALPSGKVGKAAVGTSVTEDVDQVPVRMEASLGSTVAPDCERLQNAIGRDVVVKAAAWWLLFCLS